MRSVQYLFVAGALVAGLVVTAIGQAPTQGKDDADIFQLLEKLAKAFNERDAKGVAALWAENGQYISESSGERLEGRKAIEDDYAETFAENKEVRVEIDISKIRRLGSDAASVEGSARVYRPKQNVARLQYMALLVKQNGAWVIDSVRESRLPDADTNADELDVLGWLEGEWRYKGDDSEIHLESHEVANGNFRSQRFQVKSGDEIVHEGTQIIGWDAAKKEFRAWVFASDGSFGEGRIELKGDRLTFRMSGVLPDGDHSSATQIVTRKDANNFTWEVVDRHVGTRVLPNVPEITLTKMAGAGAKKGR